MDMSDMCSIGGYGEFMFVFGDHVCLSGLPEDMPATFALFSSPLNVYPIATL